MSAMFGCGLILGFFLLLGWMIGKRDCELIPGLHHDPRREKFARSSRAQSGVFC